MSDLPQQSGHLVKLKFMAYDDIKFEKKNVDAGEYEVMFNPSSISVKLQIDRNEGQAHGSTSSEMNFVKIKPQDYQFEFTLDGTGAVTEDVKSVPDEVVKLFKVIYNYDGTQHKPNYVKVLYGAVLLKTVLKSADVVYNLFRADGTPIRAKITVGLTSCVEQALSEMINNKNSPDLTHKRVLKEKQKLITVANSIYNSNDLYVEVARKNKINNFRNLPTGTTILFPPVDKNIANA